MLHAWTRWFWWILKYENPPGWLQAPTLYPTHAARFCYVEAAARWRGLYQGHFICSREYVLENMAFYRKSWWNVQATGVCCVEAAPTRSGVYQWRFICSREYVLGNIARCSAKRTGSGQTTHRHAIGILKLLEIRITKSAENRLISINVPLKRW